MVWSVNLFNFMDGLDGFAATEALIVFAATGFFFFHAEALYLYLLGF